MRKYILVFLLVLAVMAVASCGKETEQKKAATGPANDEKVYTLNLNCIYVPPSYDWEPKHNANIVFAKKVEEATKGRVKIKVHYNSQLTPQSQGLTALKNGVVDFLTGSAVWGGQVPESDFMWLPFWAMGEDHALHILRNTKVGEIMDQAYSKQGAHILFYWPVSNEVIISKKPIKKYEEMKGLKMRAPTSLWHSWYKNMGAVPINIPAADQYEALMRGTMDGTIYPQICVESNIVSHTLVSKKMWDSLPDDLKKTIEKIALEMEKDAVKGSQRLTALAEDACKKHNVEVVKLNKVEFEKFRGSALALWDEFAARSPECAKMIEIMKQDRTEWTNKHAEDVKKWEEKFISQ